MTSCLQNIFLNYSTKNNGLLLLPLPTGFGKTHNTVEFFFNYFNHKLSDEFICSKEGQSLKRIYYMTTIKNNISEPYEKLKNLFKENGQEEEFEKYSANYNAIIDDVKNNFLDIFENQHKKQIEKLFANQKDKSTYLKLKIAIKSYDNLVYSKANNEEIAKQREELQKAENDFRKIIKAHLLEEKNKYLSLFEKNKSKSDKDLKFLNYLYSNPEYDWLKRLYPVVFFPLKKIIFMTCDKFFLPFSTILEPFYLVNSQYTKNSIVFMDEIDAIKESVLKHIINENSKEKPNLVKFVQECYTKLKNSNFTDDALCKNSPQKHKKILETKQIATEKLQEVVEKYRLDLAYKTDASMKDENNFLFYDFDKFIQIKEKFINCTINENDTKQNKIHLTNKNPDDYTIFNILKDMQIGLSKFMYYLKYHSTCYAEENLTTKSDGVTTILTRLNINEPWRSILYKYVMSKPNKLKKPNNKKADEEKFNINTDHFFSNGFSFYSFFDSTAHNEDTEINKSGLNYTPEYLLLTLCQNSVVIGLSATANFKSVLSNYNLNYLKESLQEYWYELNPQEKQSLDDEIENWNKDHQKYNITCKLSPYLDDNKCCDLDLWQSLCSEEEISKKDMINFYEGFDSNKTDYRIKRFYKTAWAFKQFLTQKNIKFFVAMLNSFPRKDEESRNGFYLPRLITFFNMLAGIKVQTSNNPYDNNKIEIGNDIIVYILKSNNFQDFSKEFLSQNIEKRIFVITSYKTLSVGINLYKNVPLTSDLININNRKTAIKNNTIPISIDGMFLELPTNVIPHMGFNDLFGDTNTNEESEDFRQKLLKYLTSVSYLANNGEISEQEKKLLIKKAFGTKYKSPKQYLSLKDTLSCKYAVARLLKQALGRMGRTAFLNKEEYIYLDGIFKGELEAKMIANDYNSIEFQKAIETIDSDNLCGTSIDKLEEKINLNNSIKHSEELHKLIMKLLQYTRENGWNDNCINIWNKLDSDIMHTIMSDKLIKQKPELKKYCVYFKKPVEKYFYKCDNLESYKNLQISDKPMKGWYEISAKSCGIEKLKLNRHAAEYLSSIGMDLSKKEFQYWPNPVAFINLFKGRLGEHICKVILEKELNIKIHDITEPEKYEKLDGYFLSKSGKKIYIDFKNWNLYADQNMELEASLEKFADKGIACQTDTVVILNMIEPTNSKFKGTATTIRKNIKIIRIQALLESENPNVLTKSSIQIFNQLLEDV